MYRGREVLSHPVIIVSSTNLSRYLIENRAYCAFYSNHCRRAGEKNILMNFKLWPRNNTSWVRSSTLLCTYLHCTLWLKVNHFKNSDGTYLVIATYLSIHIHRSYYYCVYVCISQSWEMSSHIIRGTWQSYQVGFCVYWQTGHLSKKWN